MAVTPKQPNLVSNSNSWEMSVISDGGQRQPDEKPDLLHAQLAAGSPVLLALSFILYIGENCAGNLPLNPRYLVSSWSCIRCIETLNPQVKVAISRGENSCPTFCPISI